jgi:hypothetical protein
MALCQYQNALGVPRQGVHSYRILNIAIADVGLLLMFALLLNYLTRLGYKRAVLISFVIGIVLHRIFCVRTTIDRILFP